MAAYFIDCDGTFFHWGTDTPLPGAVEAVREMIREGNQVIFITQREEDLAAGARKVVHRLFGAHVPLFSEVQTPRVLVDDSGP